MNAAPSFPSRVWAALRPMLARVKRTMRRTVEQALHTSRRRAAQAQLARPGAWDRAVVLCYGNVCRSPYAAAVLTQALADRGVAIPVLQGGFIGPGRRSPVHARAAARTHGIELRRHRSRLVTPTDTQGQTLVVVMDADQAKRAELQLGVPLNRIVLLGDLDPSPIATRTIKDPWGLEREVFEEVYGRISRCTLTLAECLRGEPDSGRSTAEGDGKLRVRSMPG